MKRIFKKRSNGECPNDKKRWHAGRKISERVVKWIE
jgi:hypothetical protein